MDPEQLQQLRYYFSNCSSKSDAAASLRNIIAEYITPAGLKIGSIRTDEGGEFEGEFKKILDSHGITHEFTPPDTPQYNGVAERVLGQLREKSIAMLQEMTMAASGRLRAEALNYACDMSNVCVCLHLRAAHRRMRSGMAENRLCSTFDRLAPSGTRERGRDRIN